MSKGTNFNSPYNDGQEAVDLVLPVYDLVSEMDDFCQHLSEARAALDVSHEDLSLKARVLIQHVGLSWCEGSQCGSSL